MTQAVDERWQQRYRLRRIFWSQVAGAAPQRGLVATQDTTGVIQLHAWQVPSGALAPLTHAAHGVGNGLIDPDGRFVYYLDDDDGDESGSIARVTFDGGEAEAVLPDVGPVTLTPGMGMAISRNGRRLAILTSDERGFALRVRQLDGAPDTSTREVFRTDAFCWQPVLSADGELAALASTEHAAGHHFGLAALDCDTGQRIGELHDGPDASLSAVMFSPLPGDDRVLGTTTASGFMRPLIWNPRSGDRIDLDFPKLEGDALPFDWSADGRHILLCQVHRAQHRLHNVDLESGQIVRLDHPGGSFNTHVARGTRFASNGEVWADWQDATHPGRVIALDSESGRLRETRLAAGAPPPSQPWRSIAFESADGTEIQGWLALPAADGPLPAIIDLHGGPEDVQSESFSPAAQAWVDHGFAFLSVNYRGSTTFGQQFQEQIWGNLGHFELQDMAAAHAWLVEQGIAKPDQIFLTGWSYGGYLTLLGLGRQPELWAGGMAGAVISDWTALYDDAADFIRGYLASIMGGTPGEKPEDYARSSPLSYAANVAAPVLVIQGRNDVRTPARQSELYAERLTSLGKRVEVEWYDSGHVGGAMGAELAITHQQRMLDFALEILKDRDATAPIRQRANRGSA